MKKFITLFLLISLLLGVAGACSYQREGNRNKTAEQSSSYKEQTGADSSESQDNNKNENNTEKAINTENPSVTPLPSGTVESPDSDMTGAINLMAAFSPLALTSYTDKPDDNIMDAIKQFSASLFKSSVSSMEKCENIMVSPASVFLALAMTLNGADGDTKDAILDVLKEKENDGITSEMINIACRAWIADVTRTGEKTSLSIANSIWFDNRFAPYNPFLQTNADYYSAAAHKLDFRNEESIDIINIWVNGATKGTIPKIIDSIPSDVVMYLINAIYFKSDWQIPFSQNKTFSQQFNTVTGPVNAKFMHRTGNMSYFTGCEAEGVSLPYDDGKFAFFALLPDNGTTPQEWLAKQDNKILFDNIGALMSKKTNRMVELSLPKFELSYENSLKDELSKLGMEIAFDSSRADFSQMNESHLKNLFINDVKHKTFIRVDEKGTEAAAVTSVEMGLTSIITPDVVIAFNRPFFYGIVDLASGVPLFIGILEKPECS